MDSLPSNTALGYFFDDDLKSYVTNTLYQPIIGGADGGIFTCGADMVTLWNAVMSDRLFSKSMREQFF